MKTLLYTIRGLDCATEANALRRTVGRLQGVAGLDFNLLNGTMSVAVEDESLDEALIARAIQEAGLEAAPLEGACSCCAVDETYWQKNGRALLCCSSGLLIAAGFIAHLIIHGGFLHALAAGEPGLPHRFPPLVILFYTGAVIAGVWFVIPKAVLAARKLRPDMNILMTVAVIGALGIGEWLEAATVAFLFALSLLLESWSVGRARKAIQSLLDITPPTARYICPHDGDIIEKPVGEVPVGVTALIRPGERIPLDGIVSSGYTTVDQAAITGESIPALKEPGSEVFAGTINETGSIEITVTKAAKDTALARIIRMVEEAQSRRAPAQQWVDTFALYYTPAMLAFACLIAVVPPLLFSGAWAAWFYEALVVLVIACPCALVISTPVCIVAALTAAARHGVLIKGGAYLEAAARVKVIALDKTGTITHGQPEVQRIFPINDHSERQLLERAAAMESHSDHPLARAVLRRAAAEGIPVPAAENFQLIRGKGAEALVYGRPFWLGNHRLMAEKGMDSTLACRTAEAMEDAGHSVIIIGNDQHVCGLISVADKIREEIPAVVQHLKKAGLIKIVMLTGDNAKTAEAVAQSVGIDDIMAELLPQDKLQAVAELQKFGPVAMIGDGINDAPALAAATLGIAMGGAGTDTAIETADAALMSDDLKKVPWLIVHAQRTLRIIKQNIGFALAVKFVFMALAMAGMATLWMAIAADMGASLLVIFNALRALGTKTEL